MPEVTKRIRAGREETALKFDGYTVVVRETHPEWPRDERRTVVDMFVHKHEVNAAEIQPRGYVAGANFLSTDVRPGVPRLPEVVARGVRRIGAS